MRNVPVITSSDLIQSNTLLYQKSLAISGRGLSSFPHDNEEDARLIRKIGRWRSQYEGCALQLPNAPLQILLDPLLTDDLVYYLALGDYEQSDLDMIEKSVREGDRVLDIGGGAGVCAARMAQCARNKVVVVEARDDLHELIVKNLNLNGLTGTVVHGAVADDVPSGTLVEFTMCKNLWFSSLDGGTEGIKIQAPSITLEELYNDHTPDVVLMDVEGAETRLNFDTTHKPRALIVEIHTPSIGTETTCSVIQGIIDVGYRLKNVAAQTWLFELA
jgi:FkbM family methyltransferase